MPETKYEHRTDSVEEKLRLLEVAHRAGNYEVAMSLAESIKDTLSFQRETDRGADEPAVGADAFARVDDLPSPWGEWARGWTFYKGIAFSEPVGLAREPEPVDLAVAFLARQVTDLHREVRVARLDVPSGKLAESPTRTSVHNYFKDRNCYARLKIKRVPGFVITKVFDHLDRLYGSYPGRAEEFSRTFLSRPTVCDNDEELLEDVDAAYIADSSSPGDGADHLELARPFLENGIPVFVDKPFASTFTDAKEMIRLAEENRLPAVLCGWIRGTLSPGPPGISRFGTRATGDRAQNSRGGGWSAPVWLRFLSRRSGCVVRRALSSAQATVSIVSREPGIKRMNTQELFRVALGLTEPWTVTEVAFLIFTLASAAIAKRFAKALNAENIYAGLSPTVRVADFGMHVYSNIHALVDKRSNTPDGFPWTLEANCQSVYNYHKGAMPRSDDLMDRSIIIPVPSAMTEQDIQDVIDGIGKAAARIP